LFVDIFFRCLTFPVKIAKHGKIIERRVYLFKTFSPAFNQRNAPQQFLSFFRIIPKAGFARKVFLLRYYLKFAFDVKDTSLTHRGVPINPLSVR
jgi:hypothetical protein